MAHSTSRLAPYRTAMIDQTNPLKRETDALIEAIWGAAPAEAPKPVDPDMRAEQNRALATAMRAYLEQYLQDL